MDKVKKIYETICETNDKKIMSGEKTSPICVFIRGNESELMELKINSRTKLNVQENVRLLAEEKMVEGYVLVFDADAYIVNKRSKEAKVNECIVRVLYTRTARVTELVWYKDSMILGKERFEGRGQLPDSWDAWWKPDIKIILQLDKNKKGNVSDEVNIDRFKYK
jgi:hypothetical protein